MGYRKISNLYKNREILHFKRCLALEKIDGTSAHVAYRADTDKLIFFSGGSKHDQFIKLFDHDALLERFRVNAAEHPDVNKVTIFGEAYGGKLQKMSNAYGKELKFVAFEVRVDDYWFDVRRAHSFVDKFGLEFVHYVEIDATEKAINEQMMADSVQAVRNGMGTGHMREGIVLRPVIELIHPNGGRVISKHKSKAFQERKHQPDAFSEEKLKILKEAAAIAEEWVNAVRLQHVLDGLGDVELKDANRVIQGMFDDVLAESKGEIVVNNHRALRKAIGKKTMKYFKMWLEKKNQ